jgi:hypothetical protein
VTRAKLALAYWRPFADDGAAARSVSALVSDSPEPEIGPRVTSTGSITSHVRGPMAIGACSADQTWLAAGRMFVNRGVLASIVFTA